MQVHMRLAGESSQAIARKTVLTVKVIESAVCPQGKTRVYIHDTRTPGLAIAVLAGGGRVFYAIRRVHGRKERIRLGAFPEISIEQARGLAAKVALKVASGVDPMEEKRRARITGMTLGQLWEWFLTDHAKPRKRSWRDDDGRYRIHIKPRLGNRPLDKITVADISALHNKVAEATTQATANRVLALLKTMFNKATLVGFKGQNPCKGVTKFKETARSRFLNGDELPRFLAALEHESVNRLYRDYFTTLLFTGARGGNVKSMRWDELDLRASVWRIPAGKAKAGDELVVHLSPSVVEILTERKKSSGSEWVFPSPQNKSIHIVRPTKEWDRILERANLTDIRMHDLRRTLGSWQAASGASLHVIGKSLGHKSVQTTAIYARLQLDPVRESVNKATEAMTAAVEAARRPAKT